MTKITLVPTEHQVFNEFDRFGVLLALPRLEAERNAEYKQRLLDVMVNRSNATYTGLINAITRELGLSIFNAMTVSPIIDADAEPLVTEPAVVMQGTKCYLYNDFTQDDVLLTIDRFEKDGGGYTLQELADTINATGVYVATLSSEADPDERSMKIFNQTSVDEVVGEDISSGGTRISLEFTKLIQGSVSVTSTNFTSRKDSPDNLQPGEYYVDTATGTIVATRAPAPGAYVRYRYRVLSMVFKASPVILHNLQSDDFKTKIFEQITDGDSGATNGLPTVMGASIINELLSVYPYGWGK